MLCHVSVFHSFSELNNILLSGYIAVYLSDVAENTDAQVFVWMRVFNLGEGGSWSVSEEPRSMAASIPHP